MSDASTLPALNDPGPARPPTLLLVDDEEGVLSALKRLFRRDGYRILTAPSGQAALDLLADQDVDVIVSDQRMPGMTGVDFLRQAKLLRPGTIRMTLSGYTDLQSIIDAVNEGAVFKFLTKPWDDERLRDHVAKAFRHKAMSDENRRLSRELAEANAELGRLNQRLTHLLAREHEHFMLLQAHAGGMRDIVDLLPAAVFGIDPDGLLVYVNQRAAELLPQTDAMLGHAPEAPLDGLLSALRLQGPDARRQGLASEVAGLAVVAWLTALTRPDPTRGEVLMLLPRHPEMP